MSADEVPPARVVKGGETVGVDAEQMWTPSRTGDNADDNPRVIANHLHALRRDVNDKLDRIGLALEGLTRIEARLDVIIDRQNNQDRRLDALEMRVDALEKRRSAARKKR